jgi:hypothetical protein
VLKNLCLAAGLVASIALGACSASQIQTAAGNVAAINGAASGALQTVATSIVAACPAGEAFASAAAAATANPGVQIAAGANGMFCAINKAIVATAPAASAPAAASAPVAASQ